MRRTFLLSVALAVALIVAAPTVGAASAVVSGPTVGTVIPRLYKNCTNLNLKYPHGVGRANARDKTKSGEPVTTFKRSTKIYNTAWGFNKGLDRDKDGIACEKA